MSIKIEIVLILMFIFLGCVKENKIYCVNNNNTATNKETHMEGKLITIKERLLNGMKHYMEEYNITSYDNTDINKVDDILVHYYNKMNEQVANSNNYMGIVKETVVKLNELNKKCDFSIIETDQREDICLFIIETAMQAGFVSKFIDITEEFREW